MNSAVTTIPIFPIPVSLLVSATCSAATQGLIQGKISLCNSLRGPEGAHGPVSEGVEDADTAMYKSLFREANHRECFVVSPTFRAYIKHISITTRATDKAPASTIDVDVECVAIL